MAKISRSEELCYFGSISPFDDSIFYWPVVSFTARYSHRRLDTASVCVSVYTWSFGSTRKYVAVVVCCSMCLVNFNMSVLTMSTRVHTKKCIEVGLEHTLIHTVYIYVWHFSSCLLFEILSLALQFTILRQHSNEDHKMLWFKMFIILHNLMKSTFIKTFTLYQSRNFIEPNFLVGYFNE